MPPCPARSIFLIKPQVLLINPQVFSYSQVKCKINVPLSPVKRGQEKGRFGGSRVMEVGNATRQKAHTNQALSVTSACPIRRCQSS